MPAFSGTFDWGAGLIWQVGFAAGTIAPGSIGASARPHVEAALVDTGASRTCIARPLAETLGLAPVGKTSMQTAGGRTAVNVYDLHVALLTDPEMNTGGSVSVKAQLFRNVKALEFVIGDSSKYRALIGRDILRVGMLSLSADGHYSFAF